MCTQQYEQQTTPKSLNGTTTTTTTTKSAQIINFEYPCSCVRAYCQIALPINIIYVADMATYAIKMNGTATAI